MQEPKLSTMVVLYNLNLKIILFAFLFCLTKKETPRSSSEAKKVKALNFYFVRKS